MMEPIGYITAKYPCASEVFLQREINELLRQGFDLRVFAAAREDSPEILRKHDTVWYRPSILSIEAVRAVLFAVITHPIRTLKLLCLMIRLSFVCHSDAGIVFRNIHTICFFSRVVEQQNIKHIHACFFNWPACVGLGISILSQVPLSVAAHSRDVFVEGGACEVKVKCAKFISCCNLDVFAYLKQQVDEKYHHKCCLNRHGIAFDGDGRLQDDNRPEAGQFIIAVGRLVEKKGFDILLPAFAEMLKEHPSMMLVIVGDGPQKQNLKSQIDSLGIAKNVHLAGWLENRHTIELIRQANVLVVPSMVADDGDRDGIPNVILEAFSVGTPVVASSLAGICDVVADGETGLLVSAANSRELAEAIRRIILDKELAFSLASNAKIVLQNRFNLKVNCKRLGECFERQAC